MIKKANNRIADKKKVLQVWIEDQTSHSIPLNQSLIQSSVLIVFSSMKTGRSEESAEEKVDASRRWFMSFKERSHLHDIKVHGEATSADVEAAASCPEDLVKIINKSGYTKH